jgi:hypothetical protein
VPEQRSLLTSRKPSLFPVGIDVVDVELDEFLVCELTQAVVPRDNITKAVKTMRQILFLDTAIASVCSPLTDEIFNTYHYN